MSTQSKHDRTSRQSTKVRAEAKNATAQIDDVLQHLGVLSSQAEQSMFKYAYLYFTCLFLLDSLLLAIVDLLRGKHLEASIKENSSLLLVVIGISLILWTFNAWRQDLPKTLRDLYKKNRIYALSGDTDLSYLGILKQYCGTRSNPRRYLPVSILMVSMIIYDYYDIYLLSIKSIFSPHLNPVDITSMVVRIPVILLIQFGSMYCLGIVAWELCIAGQCIRKIVHMFKLRIEPVHPDQCGSLKALGNLCFGLISPVFIGSAFFIGYIFIDIFILLDRSSSIDVPATIALILFIILVYCLPITIFAFFLPLWDIHSKMVDEKEANEEKYAMCIEELRRQIQLFLDNNQLEEAKVVKEKKELMEALYSSYPVWPFNMRTKLFSALIGAGGSLLLNFLGGLEPSLLKFLLHLTH